MTIDLKELFKKIDESKSIADLFELDAIPPINFSNEFFFISYSHVDYKIIYKDIYSYQKEGVSVWFDRGMKPGSDWLENAEHFISQFACKGVIIYFSKASLKSAAVLEEIVLADTYHKPLIPIVIDKDELVDGNIATTIISNLKLEGEKADIVRKSFTERTLWIDSSFSSKSKINYIINLKDDTNMLEVTDLDGVNSLVLLKSGSVAKGKMITQVNDPYCMRVKIPLDIKFIGDATFTNMTNLKEINLSHVVEIDSFAFADARQLKEVDLSSALYIGDSAFERCSELEKIIFPHRDSLAEVMQRYDEINLDLKDDYYDENGSFDEETYNDDMQTLKDEWLVEDDSAYGEGNKIIPNEEEYIIDEHNGKNIFAHCNGLKEIRIEKTFKEVPEGCFHDCLNLETVVLNGPTQIGNNAFYNCSNLKHVIFEDEGNYYEDYVGPEETRNGLIRENKVGLIGDSAFENCTALENFKFPELLWRIGAAAFKNAKLDMGESETLTLEIEFGNQAFMGSTVKNIMVTDVDVPDEAFRNCKELTEVNVLIYDKEIGASAFRGCPSLDKVYVTASEIKKSAFSHSNINCITLREETYIIDEYVFSSCNVKYFDIWSDDLKFRSGAFYNAKVDYMIVETDSKLVFDPFSLVNSDIGKILYKGTIDDVKNGRLGISVDYVDNPNTHQVFIDDKEEQEYYEKRKSSLEEKKTELMPLIASKIVFHSYQPIYDGRHWHISNETKLPEIWVEDK